MHYNKDMLRIAQMEEGEKIYHYTTIDALINIVSRKELWVTKWDYLNDMDELTVAEDVCAVVLREENVKSEVIQDVKKYIKESSGFDVRLQVVGDEVVAAMYRYTDDGDFRANITHGGKMRKYEPDAAEIKLAVNTVKALELDFAKFRENLNHSIMWDGLVNYDFESQKECLKRTFCDEIIGVADFGNIKSLEEINKLQAREYEILISHMSIICELYSMFFKRSCFKGENEYRFVFAVDKKQEISFRNKNSIVIPYIKKEIESIDFITRITIGPTNQIDIATKGIKELLHYYQRDVDVVKSEIPLRF